MNGQRSGLIVRVVEEELRTLRVNGLPEVDRADMAQEAAIGVMKAIPRLGLSRPEARAYLGKAARSAAISFLRWRIRRVEREVSVEDPQSTFVSDTTSDFRARDVESDEFSPGFLASPFEALRDREESARISKAFAKAGLTATEREILLDRLELQIPSPKVAALDRRVRFERFSTGREKLRRALAEG